MGVLTLLIVLACLSTLQAQEFSGEQKTGYYNIREGTHMFYWFFYSTHPDGWESRPLLIWHQGGPGASSTGYGNWEIIGPLNYDLEYRETTWVQECNVLFIDSPVGSGWSYVDDPQYYTKDMAGITSDLTETLKMFLADTPELEGFPLYFFGQSYGGKVAPAATLAFQEAVDAGELNLDIKAFAMGNGWVSPMDSTLTWSDFCYEMSTTDEAGRDAIYASAQNVENIFNEGDHVASTFAWFACQTTLLTNTNYVDMYNILQYMGDPSIAKHRLMDQPLFKPNGKLDMTEEEFMNTVVREMLNGTIPDDVVYGAQSGDVFDKQMGDFMDNEIAAVNTLLTTTDIQAVVYQGQLDIICGNSGAMRAVQQFEWDGKAGYYAADRVPLTGPDGHMEMFVTAFEKFKYYWVLNAGHAAPADAAEPALRMLQRILGDVDK